MSPAIRTPDTVFVLFAVMVKCDSPQFLLFGGVIDCGLCLSCCKVKSDADRQRRLYWLKRKRGCAHETTQVI